MGRKERNRGENWKSSTSHLNSRRLPRNFSIRRINVKTLTMGHKWGHGQNRDCGMERMEMVSRVSYFQRRKKLVGKNSNSSIRYNMLKERPILIVFLEIF